MERQRESGTTPLRIKPSQQAQVGPSSRSITAWTCEDRRVVVPLKQPPRTLTIFALASICSDHHPLIGRLLCNCPHEWHFMANRRFDNATMWAPHLRYCRLVVPSHLRGLALFSLSTQSLQASLKAGPLLSKQGSQSHAPLAT